MNFYKGVDTGARSSFSATIAVLVVSLQYRKIQRQQIAELASTQNLDSVSVLTEKARKALQWWLKNLLSAKGKTLINLQPQISILSDASLEGSKDRWAKNVPLKERSYKCFGIEDSKICSSYFFSFLSHCSANTHYNGQNSYCFTCGKNRWYSN